MLKLLKIKDSFEIQPEFTTLLPQKKSGNDNNIVQEVKSMKERAAGNRIEYILVRDYYIPALMIGKYEFLRKEFIKERHLGRYTYLVVSG